MKNRQERTTDIRGEEPTCPNCGSERSKWVENGPEGYTAEDGFIYCCRSCAEGFDCACAA